MQTLAADFFMINFVWQFDCHKKKNKEGQRREKINRYMNQKEKKKNTIMPSKNQQIFTAIQNAIITNHLF